MGKPCKYYNDFGCYGCCFLACNKDGFICTRDVCVIDELVNIGRIED